MLSYRNVPLTDFGLQKTQESTADILESVTTDVEKTLNKLELLKEKK